VSNLTNASGCSPCAPGHYSLDTNQAECRKCEAGKFQNKKGKAFCQEVINAAQYIRPVNATFFAITDCPTNLNEGATCRNGVLTYFTGSWHDGLDLTSPVYDLQTKYTTYSHTAGFVLNSASRFYPCPGGSEACGVNASTGKVTCNRGGSGVLCAVCMGGYVLANDGSCSRCTGAQIGLIVAAAMVTLLLLPYVLKLLLSRYKVDLKKLIARVAKNFELIRTKLKLTFVFYQVSLLLGPVFAVPYHRLPGYRWLCQSLSFLSFDFDFFGFGCLVSYSFHTKLYLISTLALALEFGAVAAWLMYLCIPSCSRSKQAISKLVGWLLVGTYFLYPSACATIFTTFNCATIDGTDYLVADYSIQCASHEHRAATQWARFMIVSFAVALPAVYCLLLVRARTTSQTGDDKMMAFFSADYKNEFFYWEVLECGRKLLLTGFSVFFGVGTIMQAVLGMLVTVFYIVLISRCYPYEDKAGLTNNQLAVIDHCALLIVLLQVIMIKYHISVEALPMPAYQPGYDASFVNTVLVLTLVIAGAIGGMLMLKDTMHTNTQEEVQRSGIANEDLVATRVVNNRLKKTVV
jgi:hypothetical protein